VRAEVSVGFQSEQRDGQDGESDQDEDRGDEDAPTEDRHPEHGHSGRAETRDVVMKLTAPRMVPSPATISPIAHSRPSARGVGGVGERGIGEPAEVGAAAGVMKPASTISPPNRNSQ